MGTSTNGIFGFGIDLGESSVEDIFDLPKIAKLMEIPIEEVEEMETGEIINFLSELEDSNLCFVTHCSYSDPIYLLVVRESYTFARRGYVESISDHFHEYEKYEKIFSDKKSFSELGLNQKYITENYEDPDFIIAALWGI